MNDELVNSLASFIEDTCGEEPLDNWLNKRYQWPDSPKRRVDLYEAYNKDIVPILKTVPLNTKHTESYKNTMLIKKDISSALEKVSDTKTEKKLVNFFIVNWGKVGSNFESTLNGIIKTRAGMTDRNNKIYAYINDKGHNAKFNRYQLDTSKLKLSDGEALSTGGVASWSKYLTIKYPKWAHVYDARVAYSLNAIIYIYDLYKAQLWPMPAGRNTKTSLLDIETLILTTQFRKRELAKLTDKIVNGVAKFRAEYFLKNNAAYLQYLDVLNKVTDQLNSRGKVACANASEIEAFLFTAADKEIFKKVLEKCLSRVS